MPVPWAKVARIKCKCLLGWLWVLTQVASTTQKTLRFCSLEQMLYNVPFRISLIRIWSPRIKSHAPVHSFTLAFSGMRDYSAPSGILVDYSLVGNLTQTKQKWGGTFSFQPFIIVGERGSTTHCILFWDVNLQGFLFLVSSSSASYQTCVLEARGRDTETDGWRHQHLWENSKQFRQTLCLPESQTLGNGLGGSHMVHVSFATMESLLKGYALRSQGHNWL